MGIQKTPNFQIPFMDPATPFADVQLVTQGIAELLDAILGQRGFTPPDATTFAALAGRVTTAEQSLATTIGRLSALQAAPAPLPLAAGQATAFGGAYASPRYQRLPGGLVAVIGLARLTNQLAAGAAVTIATLPAGYRAVGGLIPAPTLVGGTMARVDVLTTGELVLNNTATAAYPALSAVSLNMLVPTVAATT